MDKKKILEFLIKEYEKKLKMYKEKMDEAQEESNYHKGAMQSRYDTFKEEAQMLKEGFAKQYKEIINILNILSSYKINIKNKKFSKVLPGSIVKCLFNGKEEKNFFIISGIEFGKYEINDITLYTLNPKTPLGKKILNLEIGDEIEFNGDLIEILNII